MKIKERIMSDYRTFYDFEERNKKGEKITVEISKTFVDDLSKSSLPYLWLKKGYTKKLFTNYLVCEVYAEDKKGNCYDRYNPTTKLSDDKKRMVIDFEWMLEVSDENIKKILDKVYQLAFEEV